MFRIALVIAFSIAVVSAASVPSFRYSYNEPEGKIDQFYSGADDAFIYNWGYQYPGQSHSESKTHDGVVAGEFSFVDANGEVQKAYYKASPDEGFTVDLTPQGNMQGIVESFAVDTPAAVPVPQPIQYTQEQYSVMAQQAVPLDVGTEEAIARASPLVLRAVREGKLVPVLGYDNEVVFRVGNALVDDAEGSVSRLAYLLDVDTIAPRRDQRTPVRPKPGFYSAATDPVDEYTIRGSLDTEFFTDGPAYIVRIPLKY